MFLRSLGWNLNVSMQIDKVNRFLVNCYYEKPSRKCITIVYIARKHRVGGEAIN